MLTVYAMKGDVMHVLPLPFGLALALLPRRQLQIAKPKSISWRASGPSVRDRIRTENRYAEFRQKLI